MKIKKLYHNGKQKAFNVTYDDGVIQDFKFVNLLNKYSVVGTFNLNSKLTMDQFTWKHESGLKVKRLKKEEIIRLYDGHEIASHSLTHPMLPDLDYKAVMYELTEDKKNLAAWFQREIKGFAYPFGPYNEITTQCVKEAGFTYARIGEETEDYSFSKNPLIWKASFYHIVPGLENFVHKFSESIDELALCQIVGHTYEFDVYNMWDKIEKILSFISKEKDIWFASTIDIVEYLEAMKKIEITNQKIINHSEKDLWFEINENIHKVNKLSDFKF